MGKQTLQLYKSSRRNASRDIDDGLLGSTYTGEIILGLWRMISVLFKGTSLICNP